MGELFREAELPSNQSGIIGHKSQMFAGKQSTKILKHKSAKKFDQYPV